jgi:hypothetical protein
MKSILYRLRSSNTEQPFSNSDLEKENDSIQKLLPVREHKHVDCLILSLQLNRRVILKIPNNIFGI